MYFNNTTKLISSPDFNKIKLSYRSIQWVQMSFNFTNHCRHIPFLTQLQIRNRFELRTPDSGIKWTNLNSVPPFNIIELTYICKRILDV